MVSLLTLEEVRIKLDEEFAPLEPDITGYRLRVPGLPRSDIEEVESLLGAKLPGSFVEIISKYDFGDLTIGGVFFGHTGNFGEFLARENGGYRDYPWWGDSERPKNLLMIAATDGYVVLFDISTDAISAYLRSSSWRESRVVSVSFELFVRAVGTLYLLKKQMKNENEFLDEIRAAVGCSADTKFWDELL